MAQKECQWETCAVQRLAMKCKAIDTSGNRASVDDPAEQSICILSAEPELIIGVAIYVFGPWIDEPGQCGTRARNFTIPRVLAITLHHRCELGAPCYPAFLPFELEHRFHGFQSLRLAREHPTIIVSPVLARFEVEAIVGGHLVVIIGRNAVNLPGKDAAMKQVRPLWCGIVEQRGGMQSIPLHDLLQKLEGAPAYDPDIKLCVTFLRTEQGTVVQVCTSNLRSTVRDDGFCVEENWVEKCFTLCGETLCAVGDAMPLQILSIGNIGHEGNGEIVAPIFVRAFVLEVLDQFGFQSTWVLLIFVIKEGLHGGHVRVPGLDCDKNNYREGLVLVNLGLEFCPNLETNFIPWVRVLVDLFLTTALRNKVLIRY
mmetsp:Transcript_125052/g.249688  ORF Transcript_125052/g.249688 Transcript_125052/m.249688 type:complete len:370 (+) Transcript_125052:1-1110(+)